MEVNIAALVCHCHLTFKMHYKVKSNIKLLAEMLDGCKIWLEKHKAGVVESTATMYLTRSTRLQEYCVYSHQVRRHLEYWIRIPKLFEEL